MNTFLNVLLIIAIIAAIVLGVMYYFGRKMEKRQVEQQSMIDAAKQTVTIMAIDKKKMKIQVNFHLFQRVMTWNVLKFYTSSILPSPHQDTVRLHW